MSRVNKEDPENSWAGITTLNVAILGGLYAMDQMRVVDVVESPFVSTFKFVGHCIGPWLCASITYALTGPIVVNAMMFIANVGLAGRLHRTLYA